MVVVPPTLRGLVILLIFFNNFMSVFMKILIGFISIQASIMKKGQRIKDLSRVGNWELVR